MILGCHDDDDDDDDDTHLDTPIPYPITPRKKARRESRVLTYDMNKYIMGPLRLLFDPIVDLVRVTTVVAASRPL